MNAHKSRKKKKISMSGNNFFYCTLVLHHTKFHGSTLKIERRRGVQTLKPFSGRLSSYRNPEIPGYRRYYTLKIPDLAGTVGIEIQKYRGMRGYRGYGI